MKIKLCKFFNLCLFVFFYGDSDGKERKHRNWSSYENPWQEVTTAPSGWKEYNYAFEHVVDSTNAFLFISCICIHHTAYFHFYLIVTKPKYKLNILFSYNFYILEI